MSSMGSATRTWSVRCAAAGVAAVLLVGCGSGGGGDSDGKATALDKAQVAAMLPDKAAMPGWKRGENASASPMNDLAKSAICPVKGRAGCENSSYMGSVSFEREDRDASVRFWLVAYKDEKAADAAYEVLWKHTARTNGRDKADLGTLGDERDARSGPQGYGGAYGLTGQLRVGTTVLWAATDAPSKATFDKDLAKDLAALFAKRSQQAQDGEKPSAGLPSP
ncbi:hypothetical protein OG413_11405 [Streptomyces sp. NBC_01433]|uniref:hypothetical protein n=1 Tax=Streptomyces sp. NBC_01433 TaxID=2903864 RepID=UPI00225608BD|nr:hypothetical protein [Streptomyces sp. NBC_01433]MCX4675904.1 hypothetical protein [Streptomyces sp. NBC_01433]